LVSPDHRWLLTECAAHDWCVFPVEGGEPRHLTALTPHELPLGWRSDNRSIYVSTQHDRNDFFRISIFDLETARRTEWKEIHPVIAVDEVSKPMITPDGRAYAYNYAFVRSQLYLANGIR